MSTIHKCDKCEKTIKGYPINFSFEDPDKKIFEGWIHRFEFCEACVKPLAVYVEGFLKNNKKYKK